MSLLKSFYGKPKDHQIRIVNEIDDALKNGYNDIILCAPTGTGKSYIAICLALAYGSSSILTATVDLQDQYMRDFPFVKTIKGKRNFNCLKISNKKITCDNISSSLCYNKNKGFCEFYPNQKDFKVDKKGVNEKIIYDGENIQLCEYYKQKFEAILSSHTIFNYHEYLSLLKFTNQAPYRSIMVCDEAHLLENRLVEFYGYSITKRLLATAKMELPSSNIYEIDTWLALLNELKDRYASMLNDMSNNLTNAGINELIRLNEEMSKVEANMERIEFIYDEISSNTSNYVVNIERDNDNLSKVTLLPIDISKYTKELFSMSKVRLFMSATIDDDIFPKSLAINNAKFINIDSPFPVENRRVYFLESYSLNKDNIKKEEVIKKVAQSIDTIMKDHKNERGLILVTSYTLALEIKDRVREKKRIIVSNEIKREEVINALKSSSNSVMISPSLWDGIDLKDDLCRFIIIAKAPYLDLNDRRIAVKLRSDKEWYLLQSAMRLIQGCGRGVRHDKDYCKIYVLDKNATRLIKDVENKIPEWFRNACVFQRSR